MWPSWTLEACRINCTVSGFGHLNSDFDNWFLDKIDSDPQALCDMTHFDLMEQAGAEAVELIMWLTMRGAMTPMPNGFIAIATLR